MIHEEYYITSENHYWKIESDLPWHLLESDKIVNQTELLAKLQQACIIESYHPIGTSHLMELLAEDVDATGILSVELYEGYRHFYVLKKYLQLVTGEQLINDPLIADCRRKAISAFKKNKQDLTSELVNFIFSEHFAAYFFVRIEQQTEEPLLKKICHYLAQDEFRHAQAAYDILDARIKRGQEEVEKILDIAYKFKHYGHQIGDVPISFRNDLQAIRVFMKKIERLTGKKLTEYIKKTYVQ